MEGQKIKRKAWLNFFFALLLCVFMIVMVLGSAFARFEASEREELAMTYQAQKNQIYIRTVENSEALTEDIQGAVTHFVLSNGISKEEYCTYDQTANLAVFVTLGAGKPENFSIRLMDGGSIYEAVYTEVNEGSAMYDLYGSGWIYRFYNEAGEELSWYFSGSQLIERQMAVSIEGSSEYPVTANMIVSAKPGK